jgi:branched-chain amino acid transport system permease protein
LGIEGDTVDLIIIFTLVKGGVYALLAVGFSLIFGVARLINLAHTGFYMLAAYGVWYFSYQLGLGIIESIIIAVVAVTLLGILSYRFVIDRIREHHAAVLLITLGLAMAFEQFMYLFFTGNYKTIPDYVSGFVEISGIRVLNQYVLALSMVAVMIIVVMLFLTKTKLGTAIRATANDAEIASLMGISVPRTLMITMGIATALAAIAGVVMAPSVIISPALWSSPLVMMMVIVVLGGLGSIKGSIIGSFIIGFVETLVTITLPQGGYLKTTFVLLVMVIVLLVRPGGLFGIMLEEERL